MNYDPYESGPRWSTLEKIKEIRNTQSSNFHLARLLFSAAPIVVATLGVGGLAWHLIIRKDLMHKGPTVSVDKLFSLVTNRQRYVTKGGNRVTTPMFLKVNGWVTVEGTSLVSVTNGSRVSLYDETTYKLTALKVPFYVDINPSTNILVDKANVALNGASTERGSSSVMLQSLVVPSLPNHPDVEVSAKEIRFKSRRPHQDYERPFEVLPTRQGESASVTLVLLNRPEKLLLSSSNTLTIKPMQILSGEE